LEQEGAEKGPLVLFAYSLSYTLGGGKEGGVFLVE